MADRWLSATMAWDPAEEAPHPGLVDEWIFAAWTAAPGADPRRGGPAGAMAESSLGLVSGHRLMGGQAWYWSALVEVGRPLLHLTEFEVVVRRADPFIVKAPQMWAEHQVDAPMQQWSVGNEGFFVALDDPAEAAGRAYGEPTPVAMDLEWYGTAAPTPIADGYEQAGVVHGVVELMHRPNIELVEVPAHRWRRWGNHLDPLGSAAPGPGDTSVPRATFAFPDGSVIDWRLGPEGFRPSCP